MARSNARIDRSYEDALGRIRRVPRETVDRIRRALGDEPAPSRERVRVIDSARRVEFDEAAELILEGGSRERLREVRSGRTSAPAWRLPSDVPCGYHTVEHPESGRRVSLIVAPPRCYLPERLRLWAWAVQLYAARSRRSWGIGDLGDLARFARHARTQGCGMVLVNPLHAATPVLPQQPSPYSPTTRRYLNPLYLSVPDVAGANALPDFARISRLGAALNTRSLIERDEIFPLKLRALAAIFDRFGADGDFEAFVRAEGPSLQEYATFCVLAERFGRNWRRWPAACRDPRSPGVRRFAADHGQRIRFHQWLQWQLDCQLRRAAALVPVMQDLPIGIDPDGADAWAWQDVLARGMHVGAPPDEFNTKGQDWGLPPFIPSRLRQAGYGPFIETIRGTMRHAGGLRIDHVMGLFRLFWIPEGSSPADGAYVRNDAEALLAIVALESHRARAIVVGEDLGTVDVRARERLLAKGLLSYRLLWFEKENPATYPRQALAAVTTHDLPTVAGLWTGSDLDAQRRLRLNPNEAGMQEMRDRLTAATGSTGDTPIREVIRRTYTLLSRAPSVVVAATLEDAAAVETRPNMPGTVREWPNWSQPLPVPIDRLVRSRPAMDIARALTRGRKRR